MENNQSLPSFTDLSNNKQSFVTEVEPDVALTNWAGNIAFSTQNILYPTSVAEVQSLVQKHPQLKGLGSRHCFNYIADSPHLLLSTKHLNKIINLDTEAQTITVEAGIKYGELAPFLHAHGYALPNLASLPHISVAGSVITATHGSGVAIGNLATSVVALELVAADGTVHYLSKEDGDLFNGVVVNLGALGIVTKITLAVEPAFLVQQTVYEALPFLQLQANFDAIVAAGYSVSLFTDWFTDTINQVWVKSRVGDTTYTCGSEFYGARAATQNRHPIIEMPSENCTEQLGVPGPWHERLPHFKMGFVPSSGVELQSEYFVPRENALAAIKAVGQLSKLIYPLLLISEIRTIAADTLWLSPCYQQPSVALHFTWKQDWPTVSKVLPLIEQALMPFNVRPHWGKLFTLSPQVLATRYERLADFKTLIARFDPEGKFRNAYLDTVIFGN